MKEVAGVLSHTPSTMLPRNDSGKSKCPSKKPVDVDRGEGDLQRAYDAGFLHHLIVTVNWIDPDLSVRAQGLKRMPSNPRLGPKIRYQHKGSCPEMHQAVDIPQTNRQPTRTDNPVHFKPYHTSYTVRLLLAIIVVWH